jgi:hypothetical protein
MTHRRARQASQESGARAREGLSHDYRTLSAPGEYCSTWPVEK